jgi:hypothetical protein
MHLEHDVSHAGTVSTREGIVHAELEPLCNDATRQRVAVGVQPVATEGHQHITFLHARTAQHGIFLHDAGDKTGQIVVGRRVHAGHFCCFATNQRACVLAAARGDTGHHAFHHRRFELAKRHVVEEEQWHGTLHQNVIGAVVDEAVADGVVATGFDGDLDLGAHTVGAGHQQRRLVALGHTEHATKTTKRAARTGRHGALHQFGKTMLRVVRGVDVHAGTAIVERRAALWVAHAPSSVSKATS